MNESPRCCRNAVHWQTCTRNEQGQGRSGAGRGAVTMRVAFLGWPSHLHLSPHLSLDHAAVRFPHRNTLPACAVGTSISSLDFYRVNLEGTSRLASNPPGREICGEKISGQIKSKRRIREIPFFPRRALTRSIAINSNQRVPPSAADREVTEPRATKAAARTGEEPPESVGVRAVIVINRRTAEQRARLFTR